RPGPATPATSPTSSTWTSPWPRRSRAADRGGAVAARGRRYLAAGRSGRPRAQWLAAGAVAQAAGRAPGSSALRTWARRDGIGRLGRLSRLGWRGCAVAAPGEEGQHAREAEDGHGAEHVQAARRAGDGQHRLQQG